MAQPRSELTPEALDAIAGAIGLAIEPDRLREISTQMRSLLQRIYELDEEALKGVEPFHVMHAPAKST